MKMYTFRVVFEPEEEGGYHAYCPALPGCHTQGDDLPDAQLMLQDAMTGYLDVLLENKELVPVEPAGPIVTRPGALLSTMTVEIPDEPSPSHNRPRISARPS